MSTKRIARTAAITDIWRKLGVWAPETDAACVADAADATRRASTALAVAVALLRALRDRGLLSEGEIDDLFGDAAERLRDTSALNLLSRVRGAVESKEEE